VVEGDLKYAEITITDLQYDIAWVILGANAKSVRAVKPFEMDRNGVRMIGHIGSAVPRYYSVLALLPDERTGLFVAYNGSEALPLTFENETLAAFVDRFFPASAAALLVPPPGFTGRVDQYTGEYQANTFGDSYTTVEKVRRIVGEGNRRITNPGDRTLEVSVLGGSKHFVQVAPDFFRVAGGQDKLLFRRGPRGRVTKAIFSEIPEYTYERLRWWERPAFNQALLGACSAVFGTTLVVAAASQISLACDGPARSKGFRLHCPLDRCRDGGSGPRIRGRPVRCLRRSDALCRTSRAAAGAAHAALARNGHDQLGLGLRGAGMVEGSVELARTLPPHGRCPGRSRVKMVPSNLEPARLPPVITAEVLDEVR
jgi:hypothetical protein